MRIILTLIICSVVVVAALSHAGWNEIETHDRTAICKAKILLVKNNSQVNKTLIEYFDVISNYANKNDLKFKKSRVSSLDAKYSIALYSDDLEFLGTNPFRLHEFRFRLYSLRLNRKADVIKRFNDFLSAHEPLEIASVKDRECLDQ